MADKRIRKDALRVDEEEQVRRDRLECDGADWLRESDEVRHGWAFADDGELFPINQNRSLFALVGTTYGGRGDDDFTLPHLDDARDPPEMRHETDGVAGAPPRAAHEWTGAAHPLPKAGEVLIGLFCGRDRREDMLAVLADKFEEKARDHGGRYARTWYWWQVACSFGPFALQWARRLIELDEIFRRIGL